MKLKSIIELIQIETALNNSKSLATAGETICAK